jgi:hypothetical protein
VRLGREVSDGVATGNSPVHRSPLQVTVTLGAVALLGGMLLVAVAEPLSRSEIGGSDWSLRGNGALIVPFAGGPAILGGCWGALAALRWSALVRRWPAAAVIAGAVSFAVSLVFQLLPLFLGPGSDPSTYPVLQGVLLPLATLGAGILLAHRLFGGLRRRAVFVSGTLWAVVAFVNVTSFGISALLQPFTLPLIATLPGLTSAPRCSVGWTGPWIFASLLLVPVCGVLGYVLAVGAASRLFGQG